MRSLVAVSFCTFARADETSLMQDLVKRHASAKLNLAGDSTAKEARQDSTTRLLETAVKMIKNGATPDVLTFVDSTNETIANEVFGAIQNEHDEDQLYIDGLCNRFTAAIERLRTDSISVHDKHTVRESARVSHHQCRAEEAYACAKSRRCEEELRELWLRVKQRESDIRFTHSEIHGRWCVDPPGGIHFPNSFSIEECANEPDYPNDLPGTPHALDRCFNWEDTSPYPILDIPHNVFTFREWSVGRFDTYIHRKRLVEEAWDAYNAKLLTCASLEEAHEDKVPLCDQAQRDMRTLACEYATENTAARERFGQEWASVMADYELARREKDILQMDRITEWETLTIVQCLLLNIHTSVVDALDGTAPCPTETSDPVGVNRTIEQCHSVPTRGCKWAWNHTIDRDSEGFAGDTHDRGTGAGNANQAFHEDMLVHVDADGTYGTWPVDENSLTAHLCLEWCRPPVVPDCISHPHLCPQGPACSPEYVAIEQGSFVATAQTWYTTEVANTPHSHLYGPADVPCETPGPECSALTEHLTGLSAHHWATCAPPLVCEDCHGTGVTILPVDPQNAEASRTCHVHEYLALHPGEADANTFRCRDGTCISRSGRCNGIAQCGDESDELGCESGAATYVGTEFECPANFNDDVYHQCGNGNCIEKVGLCNHIHNCADESDESACTGAFSVELESTSGRAIELVEGSHLQLHTGAFFDRQYEFEDLGDFSGKTFVKYSNDDKYIDHEHVMTKIRSNHRLKVSIVKVHDHGLPWLAGEGFTFESSTAGVIFKGQRTINRGDQATEWEDTRHKEWDPTLNTEDRWELNDVYTKTYPAGTISLPGNNGGKGSYLIFLERAGTSGWTIDGCDNGGDNEHPLTEHHDVSHVADVRCCTSSADDGLTCQSQNFAGGVDFQTPDGDDNTFHHGCYFDVTHDEAIRVCTAAGKRLCNVDEVQACCGTGCWHNHHDIWVTNHGSD